jgi:AraC-like DNA-binding protein
MGLVMAATLRPRRPPVLEECDTPMESSLSADRRGVLTPPATGFALERHAPAPDLAGLVDFHWHVRWDLPDGREHVQGVLPFPCVNLGTGTDGDFVHGPVSRRDDRVLRGAGHALGTRIRAGMWPALAHGAMPAHRITDRNLGFAQAFGPQDGARLGEALHGARTPAAHRAAVEAFLRERAPAHPDPEALLAGRIVDVLLAEPTATARVADVAQRFGLSQRGLQRLFRAHVGLTPKQVLQRSRLHEAVERVAAGDGPSRAELALDLGYADQAHFTNAFRAATGRSPGRYGRTP